MKKSSPPNGLLSQAFVLPSINGGGLLKALLLTATLAFFLSYHTNDLKAQNCSNLYSLTTYNAPEWGCFGYLKVRSLVDAQFQSITVYIDGQYYGYAYNPNSGDLSVDTLFQFKTPLVRGTYNVRLEFYCTNGVYNGSVNETVTITQPNLPLAIEDIVVTPACEYGWTDGQISARITGVTSECAFGGMYVYDSLFNYLTAMYPISGNATINNFYNDSILYSSPILQTGKYYLKAEMYSQWNSLILVETDYIPFEVGPECNIERDYISTNVSGYGCNNGVIKVVSPVTCGSAALVDVMRLDSSVIASQYIFQDTLTFPFLEPGNYLIRIVKNGPYTTGIPVCEVWDMVSISSPPCASPLQIFKNNASNSSCDDGYIRAINKVKFNSLGDVCNQNYRFEIYQNDTDQIYNYLSFSTSDTSDITYLPAGTYYIKTIVSDEGYDYYCVAWDTVIIGCEVQCNVLGSLSTITGSNLVSCAESASYTYFIQSQMYANGYNWTTTGGIIITSGQGSTSITVDFPAGFTTGTVRVRAFNDCSVSNERALTVRTTPSGTPSAISGANTNICPSTTGSYSINPVANTDSYEWTVAGAGVSIQSGQGTTNVTLQFASSFTSAILQVRAVNSCGTSGWRSLPISSGVDALGIPGAIQGPTQGCPLATETYSIPAILGASTYTWRTTGGIVIEENGSHTADMSFPANFVSGSIFVRAANACGQTREVRLNVTGLTRTPGAISGQTTLVCVNTTQSYSIAPVAGATSYQWSATGDISLQSENGTEATFNFGSSFASGNIQVQAVNACGASAVRRLTVRSNVPARPGIISGLTAGLCAEESAVYSINPVNFADSYVWTFTGDLEVTAGQGSTSATYTAGTGFLTGQVRVQAQNVCGISSARVLNVRSTPVRPGVIAGLGPDVQNGSANLAYSIKPVSSATSYNWSGTNGIVIASGNGTTEITMDIPSEFNKGNLSVSAENACGEGPARTMSLRGIVDLPFLRGNSLLTAPEVKVYPNPAREKVIVQGSGITEIHLYDLSGKLLQAYRYQSEYQVELSLKYPSGMYFIEIAGEGWREVRKLVVE